MEEQLQKMEHQKLLEKEEEKPANTEENTEEKRTDANTDANTKLKDENITDVNIKEKLAVVNYHTINYVLE